jgi:hypothetical protein
LQLNCLVNFVRIPSVPPHIDYFGLVFVEVYRQGYRGASGNMPWREGKEARSVRRKPTIQRKLGFKLIRIP